jgi:predicted TIM-barrel fold metal-dependent hydrolase
MIDMHVHIADIDSLMSGDAGRNLKRPNRYLQSIIRRIAEYDVSPNTEKTMSEKWLDILAGWVRGSSLERIVLLALDLAYNRDGSVNYGASALHVSNEFVYTAVSAHKEFLFGASVNPYRKDALQELELCIKRGASLIKWIPSAQQIEPDDPVCYPFYEMLAHYGVPLLSHTGVEHALGKSHAQFNHPEKLRDALDRGVTVIAAHCGVRLLLHEPSFFQSWKNLAREYENMYGDTAAFAVGTRRRYLKLIMKDSVLRDKLLYGSDFPGIPSPRWCWQLGRRKIKELMCEENALARNIHIMKEFGMSDAVFDNAGRVLDLKGV